MGPRLREDTGRWMAHRQRDSSLRSASFRMTCGGVGEDGLPHPRGQRSGNLRKNGVGGRRAVPEPPLRVGERAPTKDAPTEGAKMGPRLREDTGRWMAHRQRDSSLRSASFRMTCGGVGGDGLPTTVFTGGECCRGQGRGGLLRRRDSSLRFASFRMTYGWRGKGFGSGVRTRLRGPG